MNLLHASNIAPKCSATNPYKYSKFNNGSDDQFQLDQPSSEDQNFKKKRTRIRAADQWATVEPDQSFNRTIAVQLELNTSHETEYSTTSISGNRKRGPPVI